MAQAAPQPEKLPDAGEVWIVEVIGFANKRMLECFCPDKGKATEFARPNKRHGRRAVGWDMMSGANLVA